MQLEIKCIGTSCLKIPYFLDSVKESDVIEILGSADLTRSIEINHLPSSESVNDQGK